MFFARQERRKVYYWVGTLSCVVGFAVLVALIFGNVLKGDNAPLLIGGYCALFATVLSLFQILEHLTCFADPDCQTKVVRILFMVPLYALFSWICIVAPGSAEYLDVIREGYESYVIYAFFQLMIALMGGVDTVDRALMLEEWPPVPHVFPLCCLEPMKVTPTFVRNCRLALFQFMVLRPLLSIIGIFFAPGDAASMLNVKSAHLWIVLIKNLSITIAFTALVHFYVGLKDFMEGTDALLKFVCIKIVIFLSFWQGLLIQILHALGKLDKIHIAGATIDYEQLQHLLICIEMMFVAFAHRYCFGSESYVNSVVTLEQEGEQPEGTQSSQRVIPPVRYSVTANLKYTLRNEDIMNDIKAIARNR
ncbi:hypothetical protein TRVL_06844 [Trypanosoma vivax]|nr:hypothetical protein TRVL_06844 [Trypanosoma vivax]